MTAATARREIDLEDLSGLPATTAIDRLRARELRPAIEPVEVTDPADHGRVVDHLPHANAAVRRGQLITLLIGQANHPPDPPPSAGESQPEATGRLDAACLLHEPTASADARELDATAGPTSEIDADATAPRPPTEPLAPAPPPVRAAGTRSVPPRRHEKPPTPTLPVASTRRAARHTRLGRRGLVGLAGAAVAVILAVAATLTPTGPGQPRRSPAPAARLATSRPAAAPPPAPGAPRRLTAPSTRTLPDKPALQRRHPAPPEAPAATSHATTSHATSASTVSNSPRAQPAVSPPRISARAERQSTPPPSPTGPLPGPYPNQP